MDRDFWESFLNTYKMYPALWNSKNPDYSNRSLRDKAYNDLVELCKTKYPQANRDFVAKKIHHFRCSFRREYKKVINSQKVGRKIYTPSLWYYNLILFITGGGAGSSSDNKNEDRLSSNARRHASSIITTATTTTTNSSTNATNTNTADDTNNNPTRTDQHNMLLEELTNNVRLIKNERNNDDYDYDDTDNYEDEDDGCEIASVTALYDTYDGNVSSYHHHHHHRVPSDSGKSSIRSSSMIMPVRNSRKRKSAADTTNVSQFLEYTNVTTAADPLRAYYANDSSSSNNYADDEFEIAGKKLAADLRSMDYRQRIFAEKLIADATFYAKLGKLGENCSIQP